LKVLGFATNGYDMIAVYYPSIDALMQHCCIIIGLGSSHGLQALDKRFDADLGSMADSAVCEGSCAEWRAGNRGNLSEFRDSTQQGSFLSNQQRSSPAGGDTANARMPGSR
jgi:hypothetical protein